MKIRRFVDNTQGGNIKVFNITDNSAPWGDQKKIEIWNFWLQLCDYICQKSFV